MRGKKISCCEIYWEKISCAALLEEKNICLQWRRQASEFGGGGAFEGQTHIWGGGQDRTFKKVLLFAHAVVTGLLFPPGDSPPSQKGAIFLGIPPLEDEYPRNIAPPPRGANAPGMSPSL